ncbi:MAG: hypothetical protein O9274_13450 [Limnobacter sp.]|uniref:hypothetical protein n=1 Tax=Limnobacter sp. TaxID=2003368 RepID=UPI0022BD5FD9|nr:hypothetical protein [Limnobacter sp.]MCZ8016702.1 hypothetical protein [Limnobacter sp.]
MKKALGAASAPRGTGLAWHAWADFPDCRNKHLRYQSNLHTAHRTLHRAARDKQHMLPCLGRFKASPPNIFAARGGSTCRADAKAPLRFA